MNVGITWAFLARLIVGLTVGAGFASVATATIFRIGTPAEMASGCGKNVQQYSSAEYRDALEQMAREIKQKGADKSAGAQVIQSLKKCETQLQIERVTLKPNGCDGLAASVDEAVSIMKTHGGFSSAEQATLLGRMQSEARKCLKQMAERCQDLRDPEVTRRIAENLRAARLVGSAASKSGLYKSEPLITWVVLEVTKDWTTIFKPCKGATLSRAQCEAAGNSAEACDSYDKDIRTILDTIVQTKDIM